MRNVGNPSSASSAESLRALGRKVVPERWQKPLKAAIDYRNILFLDLGNRCRYGVGAPKMGQTIYIEPSRVRTVVDRFGRKDTGKVRGGDWDLDGAPLSTMPKITIVYRKMTEGLSWEEAGAYALMAGLMEREEAPDECRTMEDVRKRYERVDRLIEHLQRGGAFLSRSEMGGFREFGGVYIHIGRDGTPIFARGGSHRLAVAQVLDLERIPAQVGVVHPMALATGAYQRLTVRRAR